MPCTKSVASNGPALEAQWTGQLPGLASGGSFGHGTNYAPCALYEPTRPEGATRGVPSPCLTALRALSPQLTRPGP